MGSRGTTRFVDDYGNACPMRLWVSWAELRPELLKDIFPGTNFMREPVTDERFLSKSNREMVPRVIDVLTKIEKDEIIYPVFDRERAISISGPSILKTDTKIVIMEGNYYFLMRALGVV